LQGSSWSLDIFDVGDGGHGTDFSVADDIRDDNLKWFVTFKMAKSINFSIHCRYLGSVLTDLVPKVFSIHTIASYLLFIFMISFSRVILWASFPSPLHS
jgi:hypothetical protein